MSTNGMKRQLDEDVVKDLSSFEEGECLETEELCEDDGQYESYLIYENLTLSLANDPKELSYTPLIRKQYKSLCRAMLSTSFHSTVILGDEGCGKSSLINYFTQQVLEGNCPDCLKLIPVIYFSPISCPETATEIAAQLIMALNDIWNAYGDTRVILVFDDFTKYPVDFWREYSTIIKSVIDNSDNIEFVKFIITIDSADEYIISHEVKGELYKSSLVYTIRQEIMLPKILETLKPRIQYMMDCHKVCNIEDKVYELIYGMCLAYTDGNAVSYKRFLNDIDKILCWCEIEDLSNISFETAIEYYEELGKESESEMFTYPMDIESIARHEAGHVLLAMLLSDFLYFHGVSILKFQTPTGEYCDGITIAHADPRTWWANKENYIKYIAFSLAGKHAENKVDAGAEGDLISANITAKKFVCTSGCFNSLGNNFYCDEEDYESLSDRKKSAVEEEVKNLLNEANEYARKAVSANRTFIQILTSKLIEQKYLTRKDVIEIYNEYYITTDF